MFRICIGSVMQHMAKQIEGVSEELLRCARNEFLEKGFLDASLRTIATRANTSTGAIYRRFGSKEGLYHCLVDAAMEQLISYFETEATTFNQRPSAEKLDMLAYIAPKYDAMVNFLYDNLDAFRLILRCPETGCYERLIHTLCETSDAHTMRFMQSTGRNPIAEGTLSTVLLRTISRAFFDGLFECIRQDMSRDQALVHVRQLRSFYSSGWEKLFRL